MFIALVGSASYARQMPSSKKVMGTRRAAAAGAGISPPRPLAALITAGHLVAAS